MAKKTMSKADRAYSYPKKNYLSKASSDVYYRMETISELYFFVMISALLFVGLYCYINASIAAGVILGFLLFMTIYGGVWLKKDFYNGYYFDEEDIKRVVFGKEFHYKSYQELAALLQVGCGIYTEKGIRVKGPGFHMFFHYETESVKSHDAVRKCYGLLHKLAHKKLPVWDEDMIKVCAKTGIHMRKRRHYVYVLIAALLCFWLGYSINDYIFMDLFFVIIVTILQTIGFYGIWKHTILIERNQVAIEEMQKKAYLPTTKRAKMIYVISIAETVLTIASEIMIMFFMGE